MADEAPRGVVEVERFPTGSASAANRGSPVNGPPTSQRAPDDGLGAPAWRDSLTLIEERPNHRQHRQLVALLASAVVLVAWSALVFSLGWHRERSEGVLLALCVLPASVTAVVVWRLWPRRRGTVLVELCAREVQVGATRFANVGLSAQATDGGWLLVTDRAGATHRVPRYVLPRAPIVMADFPRREQATLEHTELEVLEGRLRLVEARVIEKFDSDDPHEDVRVVVPWPAARER